MKKFFIRHYSISGFGLGAISFPTYFFVITKLVSMLLFGQPQDAQTCGMFGLFIMVVVVFCLGVSLVLSIFSGVFLAKHLKKNKLVFHLK